MFLLLLLLLAPSLSASLRLRPSMALRTAAFGMGCFWGPQETLSKLDGVKNCVAGYTGGADLAPTYTSVCKGDTGHVEAVRVTFDDEKLPLELLLQRYLDHWRQQDVSSSLRQYSPGVWLESKADINAFKKLLTAEEIRENVHDASILAPFYKAEGYHQNYNSKQTPRYLLLGTSLVLDFLPNQDPVVYKVGAAMAVAYLAIVLGERLLQGKVEEVV